MEKHPNSPNPLRSRRSGTEKLWKERSATLCFSIRPLYSFVAEATWPVGDTSSMGFHPVLSGMLVCHAAGLPVRFRFPCEEEEKRCLSGEEGELRRSHLLDCNVGCISELPRLLTSRDPK